MFTALKTDLGTQELSPHFKKGALSSDFLTCSQFPGNLALLFHKPKTGLPASWERVRKRERERERKKV